MIADNEYIVDTLKGRKSNELADKALTQNLCTPVIYETISEIFGLRTEGY